MGKTVWDLAVTLEVLAASTSGTFECRTKGLYNDLAQYRLGVPRKSLPPWQNYDRPVTDNIKRQAEQLFDDVVKKLAPGVKLDPADISGIEDAWGDHPTPESHEAGDAHVGQFNHPLARPLITESLASINSFLQELEDHPIKSVAKLVKWNEENPVRYYLQDKLTAEQSIPSSV